MDTAQSESAVSTLKDILAVEKKRLHYARIGFIFSIAALLLGLIAVVVLTVGLQTVGGHIDSITATLTDTAQRVNAAVDQINEIHIKELEASYQTFADKGVETMEQMQEALSSLPGLVQQAEDALNALNSIDIETLNQSIPRLNEVLTPVANLFGRFGG